MATAFATIGILLMICEVISPGFVLLPIGVAFILTAGVALLTPTLEVQLICLALLAPLCFFIFRKMFKKHDKTQTPTNFDGLVGKEGVVEDDIAPGDRGYVRVYGDSWKAEGLLQEVLLKDSKVIVDRVEGTKIFLRKKD